MLAAPPRSPDRVERDEPVDRGRDEFAAVVEGLIEEARQRARRRRRRRGTAGALAAALVALSGVAAFMLFDGGTSSSSASSGPVAWPGPPREDSTLVAHYSKFHSGWVLVYADGRVITNPDTGEHLERRLSPTGVKLVRSGEFELRELLGDHVESPLPADAWTDPVAKPYVASNYALCFFQKNRSLDATRAVGHLPAAAAGLLRGKERTYTVHYFLVPASGAQVECSEASSTEALALRETLLDAGYYETPGLISSMPDDGNGLMQGGIGIFTGFGMIPGAPILPHGEPVAWGG